MTAPVALYLHVPFCVALCPYCDFVVVPGAAARGPRNRLASFVAAIRREIELRADALDARLGTDRPPLGSLYLGGGTPSLLPPEAIAGLIGLVRERHGLAPDAEVTLEANPAPDERGDAAALRAAGVTRLSLGAQSLDGAELRRLGRRHRPEDVADAVAAARAAGIGSIGIDLLYDVPGQTDASWAATLDRALELGVDHLSLYALTLDDPDAEGLTGPLGDHLPVRAGARRWRASARAAQDEERAARAYEAASERLARAGFRGYEISNWARPGHESRHNLAYWRRLPHEAAGPGAHGFDGVTRWWNAAPLEPYLDALAPASGAPPRLPPGAAAARPAGAAGVAAEAAEAAILGLRLDAGLDPAIAAAPPLRDHLAWAEAAGLLERGADARVRLTVRGRLLSNELFSRLL
ncbi:MAG: radical family heme chaperone HemW [Chloroflexota bacterium]